MSASIFFFFYIDKDLYILQMITLSPYTDSDPYKHVTNITRVSPVLHSLSHGIRQNMT